MRFLDTKQSQEYIDLPCLFFFFESVHNFGLKCYKKVIFGKINIVFLKQIKDDRDLKFSPNMYIRRDTIFELFEIFEFFFFKIC